MKRFYTEAAVGGAAGAHTVLLDGRPVHTPRKALLTLRSRALAEAIAAEWLAQDEEVRPERMPLLQLANTAQDLVAGRRDEVIDAIAGYGRSDLVCYRADRPADLAARQRAAWQPQLDWLAGRFGVTLATTTGIAPVAQDEAAIATLRRAVAALDAFELAVLNDLTTVTGSLVLGLAGLEGRLDAARVWEASQVDESYQAERWGLDHEARARADCLRATVADALRGLALHREG